MAWIDFAPLAFFGVFETAGCMHHFYTLTFVSFTVEFAHPHHVPLIPTGSASRWRFPPLILPPLCLRREYMTTSRNCVSFV
ncbi:hypothetical protein DE146DRAFT_653801 [Phaeosphaeria sp. MPI-PUGE-AT-0046c]|nr:hypothetical protein DE146DRAFT_653801 [Phaeosphaeria sp. MPI-PUGE-AT-0046c]